MALIMKIEETELLLLLTSVFINFWMPALTSNNRINGNEYHTVDDGKFMVVEAAAPAGGVVSFSISAEALGRAEVDR